MIPVIRPGRVTEEKAMVVEMRGLSKVEQRDVCAKNVALPNSVMAQARKMRMNRQEMRSPRRSMITKSMHLICFTRKFHHIIKKFK